MDMGRDGSVSTVPGMGLRQNLKQGPGEAFYYRGGVQDPAVWNHFETEGRLSNDLQSMDIHTWCTIPEAELAKKCFFYIDDVSLEVIEEPPLAISTPLDEYYSGETIPWAVNSTSSSGQIRIALLAGERLVAEQTRPAGSGRNARAKSAKCHVEVLCACGPRWGADRSTPSFNRRTRSSASVRTSETCSRHWYMSP